MHHLLEEAIKINADMGILAESCQWQDILLLSQERDKFLKEYFALSPLPESQTALNKIAKDFSDSDAIISQSIAKNKNVLVKEGISLRNSLSAIQQYRRTQNG